jgi:hypothetical protein
MVGSSLRTLATFSAGEDYTILFIRFTAECVLIGCSQITDGV